MARRSVAKWKITKMPDRYVQYLSKQMGVECVSEYRFHQTRRWRFDYAFPELKVAIEIDGGVWNYGRHNRPAGYIKDMEKFNAAATLGWIVLKFTPQEKYSLKTLSQIQATIESRKEKSDNFG